MAWDQSERKMGDSGEAKRSLLDLPLDRLEQFFMEKGEKRFRALQLLQAVYRQGRSDLSEIKEFKKELREDLLQSALLQFPSLGEEQCSKDGTRKWAVVCRDGATVEMVYIPELGRGTLCISSQVGCGMACRFCATGLMGFRRNLKLSEILGQVFLAEQRLRALETVAGPLPKVSNVVFMGMGEPLLNRTVVFEAARRLLDQRLWGISKRRVTLSTSGVVPSIEALCGTLDVALAVSLHAPTDQLRESLMPINRQYPLASLMRALVAYQKESKANTHGITIEYTLLKDLNDQYIHAKALAKLLEPLPCKVNLIPWNPIEGSEFSASSSEQLNRFARWLLDQGLFVTVRKSRGADIQAACGQLIQRDLQDSRIRSYIERHPAPQA